MSFYTRAVRPALFALDAERAHELTLAALRCPPVVTALRQSTGTLTDPRLAQRVLGIDFLNPLGLAAGLDKQGTALPAWAALGFGFAEVGTVTPRPQPGNPRPRLFRLPADRAIINRFGFNSDGAEGVARNLAHGSLKRDALRIGINIGKNKETPNEQAAVDYVQAIDALHPFADYFVINVSSPNTAGLRDLQESRTLRGLVEAICTHVRRPDGSRIIPVLVKVSPDVDNDSLMRSVDAAVEGGAVGVIATNTTVSRPPLASPAPLTTQMGGLSGSPLTSTANAVCRMLFRHLGPDVPIIGVGGIFTADQAYERIRSGAALVQIYTALIYEGPGLIHQLLRGLRECMTRDGFSRLDEVVGVDAR